MKYMESKEIFNIFKNLPLISVLKEWFLLLNKRTRKLSRHLLI